MKNILLLLTAAPLLLHAAVIYETDFTSADGWTPWKIAKDSLRFDQSGFSVELKQRNNGFSGIRREIPVESGCGYLKLSATFSADKVLPGRQGPKIQAMLQFSGKTEYPGVKTPAGSYPERRAEKVFFCDGKLRKLFLNVGLQETAGKFHLRNLRLEQLGVPLDLSPVADRLLNDDVAGDGKGGWSDQGPLQDGRKFRELVWKGPLFSGVPFRVKVEEKCVLAMHSPNLPNGRKSAVVSAPAGCTNPRYLYLLHTLAWAPGEKREIGSVSVSYENGKTVEIPIVNQVDTADWFSVYNCSNAVPQKVNTPNGGNALYVSRHLLKPEFGKIRQVEFRAGSSDAIWLILGATLSDRKIKFPEPPKPVTIQAGPRWLPVAREELNRREKGSALDLSGFHQPGPAGKFGRVIVNASGKLAFEQKPETAVRFFTASCVFDDLKSCYEIDNTVQELRKNGYNMVRFHFLDQALMAGSTKGAEFNAHRLQLFDYVVAKLKQNGIYIFLDLMTSPIGYRPYKLTYWGSAELPVKEHIKLKIYFDREARRNWAEGVKKLLTHVNPYTGSRLVDDPVLALTLGYNEQAITFRQPIDAALVKPHWQAFLKRKYGTIEALNRARGSRCRSFDEIPSFTDRTKDRDAMLFFREVEEEMARFYRDTLRSLGYRGLFSQYNYYKFHHYDLLRKDLDYVVLNNYFAHPTNWMQAGSTLVTESSLARSNNLLREFAAVRQFGKPMVISEYNHTFWNRYRYEQAFEVGAYAAFQDFDLLTAHGAPIAVGKDRSMIFRDTTYMACFRIYSDPIAIASEFLTYFLFMRGDVSRAESAVRVEINPEDVYTQKLWTTQMNARQSLLALVCGFGIDITGPEGKLLRPVEKHQLAVALDNSAPATVARLKQQGVLPGASTGEMLQILKQKKLLPASNRSDGESVFESSTGELLLDNSRSFLRVNTPRLQGICALAGTREKLDDFEIQEMSTNGNLAVVSVDGTRPIREAERLVVVYATNALNNGMKFAEEEMKTIQRMGWTPSLLEAGKFRIRLRNRHAGDLKLYPLDLSGKRLKTIQPEQVDGESVCFTVDTAKDGAAVFFEIAGK